jgi:CPA2 family monovalent cation:H+ antiporter-2
MNGTPLIAILVIGIGLAFILGVVAHRFRISPIAAYLIAGVAVGPFTPGFVANEELAAQLADIGVILLMFGVGLHFSFKDLLAVRAIAVPGAILQMAASTVFGMGLAWLNGWNLGAGIVFGIALSVSSTVVITRALQNRHLIDTTRGHIAIGWLVVQDLITVAALVLLPPLSDLLMGTGNAPAPAFEFNALAVALVVAFGKIAAFVALMLGVGRRVIPMVLHYVAHTGSRELFRLAVLSVALGVAFGATELFGVSFALGAFFAGMVLSESQLSQRAAEESLPFRDAFAVLFFVSVGMLFNPNVLLSNPGILLGTLAVVMLGNGGIAYLALRGLGSPAPDSLTIASGLAQIGEFSFILAGLGIGLGVLNQEARDLILGASIISIFINPFLFSAAESMRPRFEPHAPGAEAKPKEEELVPTAAMGHAILVGYGRVGKLVGDTLIEEGWKVVVIEDAADIIEKLHQQGIEVIVGNAAEKRVLQAANVPAARLLIVAIPDGFEAGQIVAQARAANPMLPIIARAHFDAEVEHLKTHGADTVVMGEREIAKSMLDYAKEWGNPPERDQEAAPPAAVPAPMPP